MRSSQIAITATIAKIPDQRPTWSSLVTPHRNDDHGVPVTRGLRQRLRDLLSKRDDLVIDDAILVADELATHAIRHGQAPRCRFTLTEQGRRLRTEVDDAEPTQPRMRTPDQHGGRGLVLVDRLAAAWEPSALPSTRRCGQS